MAPRHRLLLIDDDPVLRQTLAELLEGAGYDVAAVAGPADSTGFDLGGFDLLVGGPVDSGEVPVLALAKPVRPRTLLGEIGRCLAARPDGFALGPWRVDLAARLLADPTGRRVRLTDKEAAILEHLHRAGGVVARETLLAEVWGYSAHVDTHTLETHIYRLRRKIEADPSNVCLLVTEAGGYRLGS
ncbi:response regulator transcription factor [Magnetospirillum sp. UT-4]|uniref:response regulator transcription factor n=1 Tax=Magnetospirillum sp. UT-4 TaxID=2681467 RepID=UPI0013810067|nr:response regulator transcription factor [Magnetospirillum sp. UT-4]CAA7621890.1 Two component response regulator [Magnetospirillum sp. UT-4]